MAGREGPARGPAQPGHHYQDIHIHDQAHLGDSYYISEFVPEIPKTVADSQQK